MEMKKKTDSLIKGAIGETIAEEMFKELGFFVMELGKEHTVNPLSQLQDFIKNCEGKFLLKDLDKKIEEATRINVLPDFVVVHRKGKVSLLEVKFRRKGEVVSNTYELLFRTYPEAHMLVINIESSNKITKGNEELKKSRFHIWYKKDCTNADEPPKIITLEEWLKEEFELKNREIIEKYEALTKRWLGNKEVLKEFKE